MISSSTSKDDSDSEHRELDKLSAPPSSSTDIGEDRVKEIERLHAEQSTNDSLFHIGQLQSQLRVANTRIDELVVIIHNMAHQMITHGYSMIGTGYDMQTLGRIINDRFPLTGTQQEIVNKSKQQPEQTVNNQP